MDDRIRTVLGDQCKGRGIEIGPGTSPAIPGAITVDPNDTTYDGQPIKADVKASICDLPFKECELDYVYFGDVLEHVTDTVKAMDECHRVLRDGGKLVALIPQKRNKSDGDRPVTTFGHMIQDWMRNVPADDDAHWQEWVEMGLVPNGHIERANDKCRQIRNGWMHHHVFDKELVAHMMDMFWHSDTILFLEDGMDNERDKILLVAEVHK